MKCVKLIYYVKWGFVFVRMFQLSDHLTELGGIWFEGLH